MMNKIVTSFVRLLWGLLNTKEFEQHYCSGSHLPEPTVSAFSRTVVRSMLAASVLVSLAVVCWLWCMLPVWNAKGFVQSLATGEDTQIIHNSAPNLQIGPFLCELPHEFVKRTHADVLMLRQKQRFKDRYGRYYHVEVNVDSVVYKDDYWPKPMYFGGRPMVR